MDRVRKLIRYNCIERMGLVGRNSVVAVLDSGVMLHPDIRDQVVMFRDFTKAGKLAPYDDCGHGTHINGILAGNGLLSNGQYKGIAPECRIINGKILNEKGEGECEAMLRALEWIIKEKESYGIRILNLSIAIYRMQDKSKLKMLCDMLEHMCDLGILVVTAAGNHGPEYGSISGIAGSNKVLTVGCHDFGYRDANGKSCEMHSGRGIPGEVIRKPDLVAPGTDITSCGYEYSKGRIRWGYISKTGTSMSVPIVVGAAALLMEGYPDISVYMMKRKLQESTTDLHENRTKQGYGMLNLEKMFYPVS